MSSKVIVRLHSAAEYIFHVVPESKFCPPLSRKRVVFLFWLSPLRGPPPSEWQTYGPITCFRLELSLTKSGYPPPLKFKKDFDPSKIPPQNGDFFLRDYILIIETRVVADRNVKWLENHTHTHIHILFPKQSIGIACSESKYSLSSDWEIYSF